jgi:phage shock protein A
MTHPAGGSGEALDATVQVDESPDPIDPARIAEGHAQSLATHRAEYERAIEALKAKVERAREHLAAAEASVARIEAEWAALASQLVARGTE